MKVPTIIEAMESQKLFGPWFPGSSWDGWRSVLKATCGLPMSEEEIGFFSSVAGARKPPGQRVRELWAICGRRAGKDSVASAIASHAAATFIPNGILRPGERAVVACVAPDRETAKVIKSYVEAFFDRIPSLAKMKVRTTEDGIELRNMVDIAVMTGNPRSIRGRPILCAILDEAAFLRDENSSSPDVEVYAALLPAMATIPQAMMIGISSPYRKSGLLYNKWRTGFGVDDDKVLVIQAPSHVMNPVLDTSDRDRQMEEDPARARAEWYAEFRDDLVPFIDPAVVDLCVIDGRVELPPAPGRNYVAAVDPSGGSSDSMTLAIAHSDGDRGILDLVREWPAPFSPEQVVVEVSDILRRYTLRSVIGDRYAGEWPRERFRFQQIEYEVAALSRSEAYLTLLPAINTPGRIELLDDRRLISQLCSLERRTARSGKDSVDHPRGGHDDVINAAALALAGAALAPQSSAEGWLEFMRKEVERGDVDRDEIQAPSYGYSFGG